MTEILCESCLDCIKIEDDMVECNVKGIIDVVGVCDYYIKEGVVDD